MTEETEFEEKVRKYLEENLEVYLDTETIWKDGERYLSTIKIEIFLNKEKICSSMA